MGPYYWVGVGQKVMHDVARTYGRWRWRGFHTTQIDIKQVSISSVRGSVEMHMMQIWLYVEVLLQRFRVRLCKRR